MTTCIRCSEKDQTKLVIRKTEDSEEILCDKCSSLESRGHDLIFTPLFKSSLQRLLAHYDQTAPLDRPQLCRSLMGILIVLSDILNAKDIKRDIEDECSKLVVGLCCFIHELETFEVNKKMQEDFEVVLNLNTECANTLMLCPMYKKALPHFAVCKKIIQNE